MINIIASRDVEASTDSNDQERIISMSIYSDHNYVYWLHLPEHTDMRIQGYIGVSNNPKQRLWEHLNNVKTNNHCNPYLSRAIKKYSDQLIQTIVFEGKKDVCYTYEEDLRPTKNIGWNITKGGACPPSALGRKFTNSHKKKIGIANTGHTYVCTEETAAKISIALKGRTLSEEHKEKIKQIRTGTTRSDKSKRKSANSSARKGKAALNAKSIQTPLGIFQSITHAAKAHNIAVQTMINWTRSTLPSKSSFAFIKNKI